MSETTPDPADVHTGTDRVELTEDERAQMNCDCAKPYGWDDHVDSCSVPVVESIVAARLARYGEPLTEVYETDGIEIVRKNLHDLRAELAAANTRCAELEGQCVCLPPPATEGPQEDCPVHGRPYSEWVERAADLQETLDRVTAEFHACVRPCYCEHSKNVRDMLAALTPEGTP